MHGQAPRGVGIIALCRLGSSLHTCLVEHNHGRRSFPEGSLDKGPACLSQRSETLFDGARRHWYVKTEIGLERLGLMGRFFFDDAPRRFPLHCCHLRAASGQRRAR